MENKLFESRQSGEPGSIEFEKRSPSSTGSEPPEISPPSENGNPNGNIKDLLNVTRLDAKEHMRTAANVGRSLADVLKELSSAMTSVVKSEINLAKAELKDTASHVTSHVGRIAGFGAFAALGIFPLMAFLVIGLGEILNNNYWLSSLVVAVLMIGIGGALAYASYKKMVERDLTLAKTRESVDQNIQAVNRKISQIGDAAQRRSA